jgi:hypothetical protein
LLYLSPPLFLLPFVLRRTATRSLVWSFDIKLLLDIFFYFLILNAEYKWVRSDGNMGRGQ